YHGAKDFDEKGLYVSFEENSLNLMSQAKKFGWDFEELEKNEKVRIMCIPVKELKEKTIVEIFNFIRENDIKRLVIDSVSSLAINIPSTYTKVTDINEFYVKRFIYNFINDLNDLIGVTTLLITQTIEGQLSRDGVSEFACDGIILINYESIGGEYSRHLTIRKMRETKNDADIHPLEISNKGIVVHTFKE
ncbi:MAG: hypothetical protein KAQ83_02680, partial [Nanoarchaeota archaeon]|nr:hypothetical protein [Nanoarchaeota archaeon]